MKRLIVALVAAVAVSAAFARLTDTQSFEESFSDFVPSIVDEDASELADYAGDAPAFPAPYNFDNFGSKYLSLDTGDATLWRTNADDAAYFDMAMQFNPCASAPEIDEDTKIAVYLNSSSNLVVLAGTELGDGTSTNVTGVQLAPGTWGRLTIAASANQFTVTLNTNTVVGTYYSRKSGDTTIKSVGFKGTGALDDFVARTTDPFIANPAVQIGGEGYASIQDALTDAGASSVIELLANNADAVTLGSGESLKLKLGEYAYTGTITLPDGYVLGTPTTADGVTTYAQVEGVAQVQGDDNVWKWFGSFADAFTYARAQGYQPNMKFKVGSDFTPAISSDFGVWNLEFIATTEDPITINLANGNAKLVSTRIKFPTTATLNAVSGDVNSMSGGTLNVPSGVVLELASYATDGTSWNITGLTGSGTIKNDGKSMYFFLGNTNYNLPTRMRESTWSGTLELSGSNTWEAEFNKFANANSKVRFNGLTTPLWNSGNDTVAIELVGDGLTITNGTKETAASYAMGGTITGSGSLTFASSAAQLRTYNFTGDFSGFAGNLTIASGTQNRVYIGSNCTGNGACISIANGATATVAAGKTWNSQNGFVVQGTLNVAGTLKHQGGSAANQIYGAATTGKIVFKNAAAITTFGGAYAGEIVIDSIAAGGTSTQVPLSFGCSSAKLTLNGVSGNAWCAGSTYTVQPAVTLAGDVNFQNGSSDTAVTFRKIAAGTGNLSLKTWDGCRGVVYNFTEIDADNYSGTITLNGEKMTSTIGNIIKAGATGGGKVLDLVATNSPTVNISSTTLNGAAAKLVQLADGIYLKIDIAIPTVENTTASVTVDGVATEIVDGGVAVAPGARVVVTYAANEGYVGGGEFVIASASASSAVDTTDISAALGVAQIGETKYATLNEAVAAARDGDTIAIVADCMVTQAMVFAYGGVTVSNDYVVTITNIPYAKNGPAGYAFRFANGTEKPVTFCGSGSFRQSGNVAGSPFLVGNNEVKGSPWNYSTLCSGSVVLDSGALEGIGTGNNLVKVEDGTFVMNGGSITGGTRGIKADTENNDATAVVTINGGVISSATALATSTAGSGSSTLTINGGQITGPISKGASTALTIPGTSTAQFSADQTAFCETGYGTKQSGDWYVVAPLSAIVFISGEGSTTNEYSIFNGDAVTPPAAAEVVGKSFSAWDPAVVSPAAGNATYTAQYTINEYSVKFVYGLNKEYTNTVIGVTYGTVPTLPANPDPAYAVAGYDITWPTFVAVTEDATYEASYSANTYTVTFYTNSVEYTTATYTYGDASTYTAPAAPSVDGYTFNGWFTDDGTFKSAFTFDANVAGNTQVAYAKLTADAPVVPTIDPASDTAVVPVQEGETAEQAAARVEVGISSDVAAALTTAGVSESTYQGYFSKTAVKDGDNWNVTAEFTDTVETAVATAAEAVVNGTATTVTVPAGLYYKVTTYTALGGTPTVAISSTLSTGAPSATISKPGDTQGFIKIELDTAPIK